METIKTPWEKFMGPVPMHLQYEDGSMVDALYKIKNKYPLNIAYDFMGKKTSYTKMMLYIERVAKSLTYLGVKEHDKVIIAMPNCPQAVVMFYAVNLIGGVSVMVHPVSAQKEIEFYINDSKANTILTLDQFYFKFLPSVKSCKVKNFIVASIKDELRKVVKWGYDLIAKNRIYKVHKDFECIRWKEFIKLGSDTELIKSNKTNDDHAVTLYSGGTTGISKGIALTNFNFNAFAKQIKATNPMLMPGDKMLAAMPTFHGFGLGVCIHSMLATGGRCILVPRFTAQSYGRLITKYKCNFIAGVPSLFESLIRLKNFEKANLEHLKGIYSGGDSLPPELKDSFDKFLKEHHATIQIREGYGATECVNASCLTPVTEAKKGSIGIPFPDTYFRIVEPDTDKEVPYGTEGEIVISGPTIMKGYINHDEETKNAIHEVDGVKWLHTGDLGIMDQDGYIFFRGRIKRMIITNGYNVYPGQIENILNSHEVVSQSCVIGVPDTLQMQKVKAFVILKEGIEASIQIKKQLLRFCKEHISKFALPYDIEFRKELPKTRIGKIAYRILEEEEIAKLKKRSA